MKHDLGPIRDVSIPHNRCVQGRPLMIVHTQIDAFFHDLFALGHGPRNGLNGYLINLIEHLARDSRVRVVEILFAVQSRQDSVTLDENLPFAFAGRRRCPFESATSAAEPQELGAPPLFAIPVAHPRGLALLIQFEKVRPS